MNKIWRQTTVKIFSLIKNIICCYLSIHTKYLVHQHHSKLNLSLAFILLNFGPVTGQKLALKISAKDSVNTVILNSVKYQKSHISENSILISLDSIKNQLEHKGFIDMTLDKLIKKDTSYQAVFNLRNQRNKVRVYYSKKDIKQEDLYNMVSSVTKTYFEVPIENLPKVFNAIVGFFETNGHSFSKVYFTNIKVNKDIIEGHLQIEKSKIRRIDKIVLNGYTNFPKTYLRNFLRLNDHMIFTKKKLNAISKLIKKLPFVSEIKPPEVLFTNDSTVVYLYLKKQASNKFDGLVGFSSKENGKGISINGYLDLELNNLFDNGESFSLYWKNNSNERQIFNIGLNTPYIFNSRFSPEGSLNIYKQDSSFINTKAKFLLPYNINTRSAFGITLDSESSSNLLTNSISNTIDDFNTFLYGVNYRYNVLNDNLLFPIKFNFFSELLTGKRNGKEKRIEQSQIHLSIAYLWSLNYKNHIFIQNKTSTLISNSILTNQLYRIGGVNSIRGFDEGSIFTSTFSYFNVEYRFTPNKVSYIYSITDLGYIDNEVIKQSSQIYSIGLGYAFITKLGLINISYAIGKFSNQPLDYNNSRFHLKIISFF